MKSVWWKLNQAETSCHRLAGSPAPNWATWQPHNWSKQKIDSREKWIAWDGMVIAGFLNLRTEYSSIDAEGAGAVYLEHLATAPGNLDSNLWSRRLSGVGVALMAFAVHRSFELDYDGRVGLHSTTASLDFYKKLADMFDLFCQVERLGIEGTQERHTADPYFETSCEGAKRLLESYTEQ